MVLFPSTSALQASFDPNGAKKSASSFWIKSSEDKSLTQKAEEQISKGVQSATKGGIELYSPEFYATCTVGGLLGK